MIYPHQNFKLIFRNIYLLYFQNIFQRYEILDPTFRKFPNNVDRQGLFSQYTDHRKQIHVLLFRVRVYSSLIPPHINPEVYSAIYTRDIFLGIRAPKHSLFNFILEMAV